MLAIPSAGDELHQQTPLERLSQPPIHRGYPSSSSLEMQRVDVKYISFFFTRKSIETNLQKVSCLEMFARGFTRQRLCYFVQKSKA